MSMKKAIPLSLFAAAIVATGGVFAEGQVVRLSEPVNVTDEYEEFGGTLPADHEVVSLSALVAEGEKALGRTSVVEARVSRVCKKKGCFFIAQDGNTVVRVSFRDYGFFVPTDISGRRVMLVGELVEKSLSPEQAAHFRADLDDESAPLGAGVVYEIVADAVRVPLTKT